MVSFGVWRPVISSYLAVQVLLFLVHFDEELEALGGMVPINYFKAVPAGKPLQGQSEAGPSV